jgi:hypothetical protein
LLRGLSFDECLAIGFGRIRLAHCVNRFNADLKVLTEYFNSAAGDSRDVVQKIRPVLESYCKYLSPGMFAEADWACSRVVCRISGSGARKLAFR